MDIKYDATDAALSSALTDAKGNLLRPTISDKMPVPRRVQAHGDEILFDFSTTIRGMDPPNDLLHRFANAKDLVGFAQQFGPLGLFHGTNEVGWPAPERIAELCDVHSEKLSGWEQFQRQVRAVLVLIGDFRYGNTPTMNELIAFDSAIGGGFFQPNIIQKAKANESWRRGLALRAGLLYTKKLTTVCRLSPVLRLKSENQVEMVFQDPVGHVAGGGISLPGALTVQLMSTFTGVALTFCSVCSRAYTPSRRPAAGRNRFCPECAEKGPSLLSKRKQRHGSLSKEEK